MKQPKFLYLLSFASATLLFSCQKEKEAVDEEVETTFTLSENQATGEAIADDANVLFFEASASEGLMSGRTAGVLESSGATSCATVTVEPANSFPKTITLDFGAGCTSNDNVTRSGKIIITLSDSVHKYNATAVMSFDNYKVSGFKVEGTITWVNTTTPNGVSWTRSIENGKITNPSGNYYWLHVGSKTVQQTAGVTTPLNLLDDVYSITGDHTVTNPAGRSRTATITEALEKKVICANVSKGKIKIQGPNHFAILDYGDGTCDRVATISIDGNAPRNILLP